MMKFRINYICLILLGLILYTSLELAASSTSKSVEITFDTNQTKVYGPGLFPNEIILPARYFFIEAFDTNGNRLNKSLGDRIKVQFEGETATGLNCNAWVQILDCYDGSYIVRHIAQSPYKYKDPIFADECNCPVQDVTTWACLNGCPDSYPQLDADLSRFDNVDMDDVLRETVVQHHQPKAHSFCNYVIVKQEIYRRCYGEHVGFSLFIDNILQSLVHKMKLPDLEFIFNVGDWPLSMLKTKPILPIFSWCGSEETADIVMPTYDLTESSLEMMRRVTVDMLSVQAGNAVPWAGKRLAAFWRGRDSRQERLDLIEIGRKHANLFNVSITNFFFFRDQEEKYGPKEKHESFFKFFDYKFQLNIDGTVAAYRFPYLLAGSGVVFKQDSEYYEHFYKQLEPYVHYIPFNRDLSNLVQQIQWAMDHDEEARAISEKGRQFAQENLLPKEVFCYYALLFKKWGEKIVSEVRVREEMTHVPLKDYSKRFGDCNCRDRRTERDEL